MRNGLGAFFVLFCLLSAGVHADEPRPSVWSKVKGAVAGSAKVVANKTVTVTKNVVTGVKEFKKDLGIVINGTLHPQEKLNFIMASLGDSITSAVNVALPFERSFDLRLIHKQFNLHPVVHDKYSWATGDATDRTIASHLSRLRGQGRGNVVGINVSKLATESSDLARQAKLVLDNYVPHYVTILSGANDLCEAVNAPEKLAERYERNITSVVETFKKKRYGVKILLVGVPNLERIYEVGRNSDYCQALWRTWGFCKTVLGKNADSESRQRVFRAWSDMNYKLKQIADRYPNNVKYTSAVAEAKFEDKHVSKIDCFHPSYEGQRAMAEVTWDDGWYANNRSYLSEN